MHRLTGKGRNSERKTRSSGERERERVNEANRIRMGECECEWESLAWGECSVFGISKPLSLSFSPPYISLFLSLPLLL